MSFCSQGPAVKAGSWRSKPRADGPAPPSLCPKAATWTSAAISSGAQMWRVRGKTAISTWARARSEDKWSWMVSRATAWYLPSFRKDYIRYLKFPSSVSFCWRLCSFWCVRMSDVAHFWLPKTWWWAQGLWLWPVFGIMWDLLGPPQQ